MQVKVPTVIAASKHEQKTTEAPSSVSVVTRQDIEQFGYRTLSEILSSVRGFYISSDQVYNYIGVRGVKRPGDYGGRVLIQVNGHRMNEPVFDQAFNGHDLPLDVDLIERVEVIRGPGSSLYGNNAAFGVVNIITREASSWNGIEASASGGSYESFTGRLTYGKEFTNGMSLILSGTLLNSEGQDSIYFPDFSSVNGGFAKDLDGERAQKYFASFKAGEFTLEAGYGDRRRDIPNGAYGALFNTSPTYADDERAYFEARHEHEFDHDWNLKSRAYLDYYRFEGRIPFEGAVPTDPPIINYDYSRAKLVGAEFQATKTFSEENRLTLGTEWNHAHQIKQVNYDINPPVSYSDVSSDWDTVGFFVQDEWKMAEPLTLNLGARYDWHSNWGDTVNPRVAAIYNPWEQTTFKAIYGQAFRAPNAFESDYVAPGYVSNPALQPEKIRTAELAWEQGIGQNYRLSLSGFHTELSSLISQTTNGLGEFFYGNAGEITTRGFESEFEAVWNSGWRARASYSCTHAEDDSTGQHLSNSPRHLGKLNVAAPLWTQKLYLGVEAQAMSKRDTISNTHVPGYAIFNVTLFSRELVHNLDWSISVYNLFDKAYSDPVSDEFVQTDLPRPGRTFRIKLTYRF